MQQNVIFPDMFTLIFYICRSSALLNEYTNEQSVQESSIWKQKCNSDKQETKLAVAMSKNYQNLGRNCTKSPHRTNL